MTEAIQYFQAGNDDPPTSSAASILSGRSFGSRKITLRVHISVEYDGPSLSDTSSLVSLEEYQNRNSSQLSFSLGAPSELDDDAVTVSSRDTGAMSRAPSNGLAPPLRRDQPGSQLSGESSWDSLRSGRSASGAQEASGFSKPPTSDTARVSNPSVKDKDPSISFVEAPFERLKLEEALQDDNSSVDYDHRLSGHDRGAAWLRDQNDRTLRTMLGVYPAPSVSLEDEDELGGDLALERDPRGKYYYSYTHTGSSGASQSHEDAHEDAGNEELEAGIDDVERVNKPRPTSRHLNWLAAQQIATSARSESRVPKASFIPTLSEPSIPENDIPPDIPPEFRQYIPVPNPPQEELTECSECSVLLDSIRYVCSTCGEKAPKSETDKGKGKIDPFSDIYCYPPKPKHISHASSVPSLQKHHSIISAAPSFSSSSRTYVGTSESVYGGPQTPTNEHFKPSPNYSTEKSLAIPGAHDAGLGYELCSGCIESAGVTHAIEAGLAPGSSPIASHSPIPSPEDAQRALEWRRSAPRHKGQLRHAYQEKIWGHSGWEDVGMDLFRQCLPLLQFFF